MARDLQLTPEQQKQVEEAFERGAERLEKFRTATREQFDVLKKQLDDDIDRVLTPEQRVKHQTMGVKRIAGGVPPPGGRGPAAQVLVPVPGLRSAASERRPPDLRRVPPPPRE